MDERRQKFEDFVTQVATRTTRRDNEYIGVCNSFYIARPRLPKYNWEATQFWPGLFVDTIYIEECRAGKNILCTYEFACGTKKQLLLVPYALDIVISDIAPPNNDVVYTISKYWQDMLDYDGYHYKNHRKYGFAFWSRNRLSQAKITY